MTARAFIGTALLVAIITAALLWSFSAWSQQWMDSDLAARGVVLEWAGVVIGGLACVAGSIAAALVFVRGPSK